MGGALITFAYFRSGLQEGEYYFISFNTLLSMKLEAFLPIYMCFYNSN